MGGERVIRIFPTICVHMWRVRYVSCHSCNGNGGQCSKPFILFSLAEATYKRYPVVRQGEPLRKLRAAARLLVSPFVLHKSQWAVNAPLGERLRLGADSWRG